MVETSRRVDIIAQVVWERRLQLGVRTAIARYSRSQSSPSYGSRSGRLLPQLLGKPNENSLGASDVAEPIHVSILDHFADELRAALAEPDERIFKVIHGEHDAQVTKSVYWGVSMIGNYRWF